MIFFCNCLIAHKVRVIDVISVTWQTVGILILPTCAVLMRNNTNQEHMIRIPREMESVLYRYRKTDLS